jgi:glycosyltransferase-like protein
VTVSQSTARPSVGIFTYSTVPRGSVVHAAALAEALCAVGWDATLYALHKDGRGFFRPLRARLCLVPAAPAPGDTAALVAQRSAELASFLADTRPDHDLHHAQDCLSASGLLAARAGGVPMPPLVRTVHHLEAFADPHLAHCQERSIRQADACFTVSELGRREVAAALRISCRVVGNGVDLDRARTADPARVAAWQARASQGGPIILAVGGIEPRKNSLRLLAAFARLRVRHPAAQLWIVGGASALDHGGYRAEYARARGELDPAAGAAIHELGAVSEPDLAALYRVARVVALPSLQEGFGLVALEALAAGVALVASDRPPFTEFLDHGCGTLVDPLSVESIAAGLGRALRAPPSQIAAGRRRAQRFSWPRVAAAHLDGYERILGHAGNALRRSMA